MADILSKLKSTVAQGLNVVSTASNKLAANTRFKVNEMNLSNQRKEILDTFGEKAYAIWQNGGVFPEELDALLAQVKEIEGQLDTLRAEQAEKREADRQEALARREAAQQARQAAAQAAEEAAAAQAAQAAEEAAQQADAAAEAVPAEPAAPAEPAETAEAPGADFVDPPTEPAKPLDADDEEQPAEPAEAPVLTDDDVPVLQMPDLVEENTPADEDAPTERLL